MRATFAAFFAFLDMTAARREWCYQLLETDDKAVLDAWMSNWSDLVEFEVNRVVTSTEAAQRVAPRR